VKDDIYILAKNGCLKSQSKLLLKYKPLLISRARKALNRHGEDHFEDLYQEGCLGFLHGCKKFEPLKGSFRSYVTYWVDSYIKRYNTKTIRIPSHILEYEYRYYQVLNKIDEGIPLEDAVKACCIPLHIFEFISEGFRRQMLSLDYDADSGLGLLLPDKDAQLPEDIMSVNERGTKLLELIETLREKEKFIIKHSYGLGGFEIKNGNEIAKIMGCNRSNIYYIYNRGMQNLKDKSQFLK